MSPSDFEWAQESGGARLQHRSAPTRVYLELDRDYSFVHEAHLWRLKWAPGDNEVSDDDRVEDWGQVLRRAESWVACAKREITSPNYWGVLASERLLRDQAQSASLDNRPFTPPERKQIATAIQELKEHTKKTRNPDPDQMKIIADRLTYLEEASERVGRKDWINLSLGVLSSLVMSIALPPEAARELFRLAGDLFKGLFGGPTLLR